MKILNIIKRIEPGTALLKCITVLLACFFGSYITGRFHEESGSIGAILACTSAIVVLQDKDLKKLPSHRLVAGVRNFYRSSHCLDLPPFLHIFHSGNAHCSIYRGNHLYATKSTG